MLRHGAETDAVDKKYYQTALHIACISENFDFVKLLIQYGAEIGPVDSKLKMPINYVEDKDTKMKKKIFKFMKSKGAEISWKY